jgi:Fur family transcriptional regulator, ferric uptake regulator
MEAQKILFEYLKQNDLKNTPERMIILQEVMKLDKHFEAENLFEHIKTMNIKVSRASIYRTLDLLVQCGLVNKINFDNSCFYYETTINKSSHDHFICNECGKIIEFYYPELEDIHKNLIEKFDLSISEYSHQIYGICKDCKQQKNN